MILEVTNTRRETLVWAPTATDAEELRRELTESGYLVRAADLWELSNLGLISEGEHLEFDTARIFNVEIGSDANASLQALVDSGHVLVWHRRQRTPGKKLWGMAVSVTRTRRTGAGPIDSAVHFGLKVRGSRELRLRISRDSYARKERRKRARSKLLPCISDPRPSTQS